ncbi:MAG: hypothetical protein N3A55_11340, partial [Methylohalobius sp.]|nr:hypothetical protein [Methylohalobius sp.]
MRKTNSLSLPPEANGFTSPQIALFQSFLGNERTSQFSNTIELWDAIPKYWASRRNRKRKNGLLESARLAFCHRGIAYEVMIHPARVETAQGKLIEVFPGEREEIIEDALRKLAAEKGRGFCDSHGPGVVFTTTQIRRLLEEHGHLINYPDLITSLRILLRSTISLAREGEKHAFFESSIITALGAVSREDWRKDPSAKWYVRFNSLIEA